MERIIDDEQIVNIEKALQEAVKIYPSVSVISVIRYRSEPLEGAISLNTLEVEMETLVGKVKFPVYFENNQMGIMDSEELLNMQFAEKVMFWLCHLVGKQVLAETTS